MNKPVGILGGTFDPIHFGHLRPALEALEELHLAEVRLTPCRQPVHRGQPTATPEQRLAMLTLAIDNQSGLIADQRELIRNGPSYMVDTLRSMRDEMGDTPVCLLLGTDAFDDLIHWRCWQEIPELAHLVILRRPGAPSLRPAALEVLIEQRQLPGIEGLTARPAGGIWLQPITQLDISATHIRQLLATGNSPRYLLPEPVLAFIRRHRLYQSF
jgi:nicotinate-nucleotide adenylyltransferase